MVNWNVHVDNAIEVGTLNEADFKVEGTSTLSKYTTDMNKVIRRYKRDRPTDDNTMYLFFVQISDMGNSRKGFMPLAGNYGFIFNFNVQDFDLLAHELAHGAFNLRHTFSDKAQYHFPVNQTANLMDYAGGAELWKYQWDLIHDPEKILFAWEQDEEEGAAITRDTEVAWVLEIYSPQISEKFIKAYEMSDLYEMRRLTYWALSNQFNDDWVERKTSGFDFPKGKPVANLRHNAQAANKGLRVYFTENKSFNEDYHGIVGNMLQPVYFKPHHKTKFQDAYFPVDIKLYEGEDELATGDSYYGSNDFIGEYSEASLVIGIGKGSGFMVGYMRGYGYCEYAYSLKGSGLNITAFSYGVIEGAYTGLKGGQNPYNLTGAGSQISYGGYNTSGATWVSYFEDGNTPSFEGTSKGFAVGIAIPNGALAGFKTETTLLFPLKSE